MKLKDDTKELDGLLANKEHGLLFTFKFKKGVTYYFFDTYFTVAFKDKHGKGHFLEKKPDMITYESIFKSYWHLPHKKIMIELLENGTMGIMLNEHTLTVEVDKYGMVIPEGLDLTK